MDENQKRQKEAQEIVKNNQTGTYVIEDMVEAIEEMKFDEDDDIRKIRQAVSINDEAVWQDLENANNAAAGELRGGPNNSFQKQRTFRTSATDIGLTQKLTDPNASFKNVQD